MYLRERKHVDSEVERRGGGGRRATFGNFQSFCVRGISGPVSLSVSIYKCLFAFCVASFACRRRLSALSLRIFLPLFTRDLVQSQRVDKHAREVRRSPKSNNQVGKLD